MHPVGAVPPRNQSNRAAIASLLLLPLLWLWPSVLGHRRFVPYDLAQFPPVALQLAPDELAAARDGANMDPTEPPVWFVPELQLAQAELRAGRLPTWNPHARSGAPLHAHGLIGLMYPPMWLTLLADEPERVLWAPVWINLALGGVLAFGLFRRLRLPRLPAWFGAVLFQLAGPLASNAFFWMRLGSLIWLPGLLWALLCLGDSDRPRLRQVLAVAGCLAATWLAGFPPFAATTTLLGGCFGLWLLLARARAAGVRAALPIGTAMLAAALLGGCLALPQVLPSLQFFPHSARTTSPDMATILAQQFERYGLLGYLLPDAFGHPTAQHLLPYGPRNPLALLTNGRELAGKVQLPNWNYTEYAVFVGQLGLLLALLGALCGRGGRRLFAVAMWVLCLGLAMCWPGVRELYRLPLFQNVWPMRWLAPATLFVAWLAALGLDRLQHSRARLPILLAVALSALLVASRFVPDPARWTRDDSAAFAQRIADRYGVDLDGAVRHVQGDMTHDCFAAAIERVHGECARALPWLAGGLVWSLLFVVLRQERHRRWLGLAAGVGAALQLGQHGSTVTRGSLRSQATTTAVHEFLQRQAAARADDGGFMIARGDAELPLPGQLPPGQLMTPGIRDLQFYSHADRRFLQPLRRLLGSELGTRYAAGGYLTSALPHTLPPPSLAAAFDSQQLPRDYTTPHPFTSPLLDLYGVRYVLSVGSAPLPHVGENIPIAGAPGAFHVQERASALPRAFAVATVQGQPDDAAVIAALLAPDFAPRAICHVVTAELPAALPAAAPTEAPARAVRFLADTPARIELSVAAGQQPWLLLTDTFLPGWTATVDDRPQPILRGNHAFRLLPLPPGACTVVFTYSAPGLLPGLGIAATALALAAVYGIATGRRRRRTAAAVDTA